MDKKYVNNNCKSLKTQVYCNKETFANKILKTQFKHETLNRNVSCTYLTDILTRMS